MMTIPFRSRQRKSSLRRSVTSSHSLQSNMSSYTSHNLLLLIRIFVLLGCCMKEGNNNNNNVCQAFLLCPLQQQHQQQHRHYYHKQQQQIYRIRQSFILHDDNKKVGRIQSTATTKGTGIIITTTRIKSKSCTRTTFLLAHPTTTTTTTSDNIDNNNRNENDTTLLTMIKTTTPDDVTTTTTTTTTDEEDHENPMIATTTTSSSQTTPPKLLRAEGLLAVYKPLHWTSSDVVSYIRRIIERDVREKQEQVQQQTGVIIIPKRSRRKPLIKVGHGGTLDPLATGVLVIGIGSGTKELQSFLSGTKQYIARGQFGFETNTLDMEGNITKTSSYEHITQESILAVLPKFIGTIEQIPPIFSAIKKNGKALYKEARKGKTIDDIDIPSREVVIKNIILRQQQQQTENNDDNDGPKLPEFEMKIDCGGGTYIRSLIRDIGYELQSVATMTYLERTKQSNFTIQDVLYQEQWNDIETIYQALERYEQNNQQNEEEKQ